MAQFETLNQQNSDELRRYLFQLKADIENTINLMEDDQARFRQEVKTNNDALKREMQDVINKINSSSAVGEVYHNDTELAQGDISDSDEMPIYDASASTYKKTLFSSLKSKFWGYVQAQLATVATSGSYNDLSNKPNLASVATSGSYNDLSNKPTIPSAQVQTDWNATSGMGSILHKPNLAKKVSSDLDDMTIYWSGQVNDFDWIPVWDKSDSSGKTLHTISKANLTAKVKSGLGLASVATSGSYGDLSNRPNLYGFAFNQNITLNKATQTVSLPKGCYLVFANYAYWSVAGGLWFICVGNDASKVSTIVSSDHGTITSNGLNVVFTGDSWGVQYRIYTF